MSDLWWTETSTSGIPASRKRSIRISTSGLPPTLSSGLGVDCVRGRSRRPSPPAMMTASVSRGASGARRSSSRRRSCKRPPASTSGRWRIRRWRIIASASARAMPGRPTMGARFMASTTFASSATPRRIALRTSPSVTRPANVASPATTSAICLPLRVTSSSASRSDAVSGTQTSARFMLHPPSRRIACGPAAASTRPL